MSVPVGKRKQAQSAYVQKMIELQKLTMERMKATPSRYRKMLNDPIWAHQSKAYMEVVKANGIRPKSPEEIKRRDDCLKKALKKICTVMKEAAASIGLTVNAAKIRLQKVTAPFTFLKIRYRVTETGKILRQITRSGIVRQRQKLKRFRHLVDRGKMSRDDVAQSMQSWLAHLRGLKAWHAEKNMIRRYKELFSMC